MFAACRQLVGRIVMTSVIEFGADLSYFAALFKP